MARVGREVRGGLGIHLTGYRCGGGDFVEKLDR